jgi:hypothetical protein
MNQLSIRPQFIATLNFILATDPPPSLQSAPAVVDCLWQMTRMEDLRRKTGSEQPWLLTSMSKRAQP